MPLPSIWSTGEPVSAPQPLLDAIAAVEDPEVPITLVDLGVVRDVSVDGDEIRVLMVPTRLGCPGRPEMERRVREAVRSVDPSATVAVEWKLAGWSPVSITPRGREALREHGYTAEASARACPYCGSGDVREEGGFGGSLCKAPLTCRSCGSPFDALRSAVMEDRGD
jgi:ring-1,2-phenylacetyl-CoA epoxidase subunit PaaD